MPKPGVFKIEAGLEGPHLVLDGANGERVVWSETYADMRGIEGAVEVIVRTVLAAAEDHLAIYPATEVAIEATVQRLMGR